MDPIIGAALIGAGANVGSGLMGMFGGGGSQGLSRDDQRFMAHFQMQQALRNEDFQKNYVQRRSEDALKAGVHPLAALGIQPAGFAQAIVGNPEQSDSNRWDKAADMTRDLGQDVSRAVSATATPEEKLARRWQLLNLMSENEAIEAKTAESLANARYLDRLPGTPQPPHQEPSIQDRWGHNFGDFGSRVAGPRSHAFWKSVGRSGKLLLNPFKRR